MVVCFRGIADKRCGVGKANGKENEINRGAGENLKNIYIKEESRTNSHIEATDEKRKNKVYIEDRRKLLGK